ncbi:MAG: hypothetical protein JST26_11730 [Bacteroidetes bacterium]|nr:hypothetical protein [Bacteroidota bacterium]
MRYCFFIILIIETFLFSFCEPPDEADPESKFADLTSPRKLNLGDSILSLDFIIDSLLNAEYSYEDIELGLKDTFYLNKVTDPILKRGNGRKRDSYFEFYRDGKSNNLMMSLRINNKSRIRLRCTACSEQIAVFYYSGSYILIDKLHKLKIAFMKCDSGKYSRGSLSAIYLLNDSLRPIAGFKMEKRSEDEVMVLEKYNYFDLRENNLYGKALVSEYFSKKGFVNLTYNDLIKFAMDFSRREFMESYSICLQNGAIFSKDFLWEDPIGCVMFEKCN